MKQYMAEAVQEDDGEGSVTVGSSPANGMVSVEVSGDEGGWCEEFTPAKARELGALLLKHADRAEGK